MEASFDNKTNLLNANIRSSVDNSIIYTISTSHNLWGRTITILKDANPLLGDSPIVGAIYWRERLFEVHGHRKSISDIKTRPPGFSSIRGGGGQGGGVEKIQGRRVDRTVKDKKKKNERTATTTITTTTPRTTATTIAKREGDNDSNSNSVPQCTFWPPLVRRSSAALLGYLRLVDWWRSVTCTARYWRWAADRSEFKLSYQHEQWKVSTSISKCPFLFHFTPSLLFISRI